MNQSMQHHLRTVKKRVLQVKKDWQFRLNGDARDYANQIAVQSEDYPYLWGHCQTPIMKRSPHPLVNTNRLQNMTLAAQYIHGLLLGPGQFFGFWNRVPFPHVRNGFRPGPMLVRGKLSADVGGGLCQVSTTLFQAFLWANLEIRERSHHSIDAHGDQRFFTLGQDAAVAYGYKDLIVKNVSSIPLRIELTILVQEAMVQAKVWGQSPNPNTIKIESEIKETIRPNPPKTGMGWRVQTQRWHQVDDADWQMNYQTLDTYHPYD